MASMKQIPCPEHSNRILTNYCCAAKCMVALCPECLPAHLRARKCDNSSIQHIDKVYDTAIKKSQKSLNEINQQIDLLRNKRFNVLNQVNSKNLKEIKACQSRVEDLVRKYFADLQRQIRGDDSNRQQMIQKTIGKYESFRDEVKQTAEELDRCSNLNNSIKTMINLNLTSFFLNLRQQTEFLFNSTKSVAVHVEPNLEADLNKFLQKSVTLKKGQDIPVEPVLMRNIKKFTNLEDLKVQSKSFYTQSPPTQMIDIQNFFDPHTDFRVLHYFEPLTRTFNLIPTSQISKNKTNIHKVQLNSKSVIKENHRSIITPEGYIFVLGGRSETITTSEDTISSINLTQNTLDQEARMIVPRQNMGAVYFDGYIYIISGETDANKPTTRCQKYNIRTRESTEIAACNYAVSSPAVCLFKNKYILKIGGRTEKGTINNYIQRYDIRRNTWELIDPVFSPRIPSSLIQTFSFTQGGLAAQINYREILFTFGLTTDLENSGVGILKQVGERDYEFSEIMQNRLPVRGTFVNGQAIVENKILHVVQNRVGGRRYGVLMSDGYHWEAIS